MKFAFEEEDSIYGLLLGIFLIGITGIWFKIPLNAESLRWTGIILVVIAVILSFLDIIHVIQDLSYHPIMLIGSFLNNIIDLVLEFALLFTLIGIKIVIPYFSQYVVPLTQTPKGVLGIGIFFVVTSAFWLVSFFTR